MEGPKKTHKDEAEDAAAEDAEKNALVGEMKEAGKKSEEAKAKGAQK